MKQLHFLVAFGLLVPSTALAQVDAEMPAQCQDTRDFYGCVGAFTTLARRSNDIAPFAGVIGELALPQRTNKLFLGHESGWSC